MISFYFFFLTFCSFSVELEDEPVFCLELCELDSLLDKLVSSLELDEELDSSDSEDFGDFFLLFGFTFCFFSFEMEDELVPLLEELVLSLELDEELDTSDSD